MADDECGAQMPGCMASCQLPADHVQHRDSDGDRWDTQCSHTPVPPGWESLVYDPHEEAIVSLRRTFAGIVLLDDGVACLLEDDRPDTLNQLGPIARRVLIARLRAWADHLDAHGG